MDKYKSQSLGIFTMYKKSLIFAIMDDMADVAYQIEHEQILERQDMPDQFQGISPRELAVLLKNYPRIIDHNTEKNPYWDTHVLNNKATPKELDDFSNNSHELLPYNFSITHASSDYPTITQGECEHTALMKSAIESASHIDLELMDGTRVSLDPITMQHLVTKDKCAKTMNNLHDKATFQKFLNSVYGVDSPDDPHFGHGPSTDSDGAE